MKLFNINDFLKNLLNEGFKVNILDVIDNLNGTFTLKIENTSLYIRVGKLWNISGIDYKVKSIQEKEITITGPMVPSIGITSIYPVYYYHGTITQTNGERVNIPNSSNRTPLIYLVEPFREQYPNKNESNILADINIRLFFLDESEIVGKTTDQYYNEVINKMRSLCETYITRVEKNTAVNELEDINIISHARFANFVNGQGYEKDLFSDHLSGVEASFSLKIQKKCTY